VRVALSILEQVGALTRHHETPRTLTLTCLTTAGDATFVAFVRQMRLPLHLEVTRNYHEVATATQISLPTLETQLLLWQDAGWLRYQAAGRDLLLTLLPPPANISAHLDSLLDQHATIQKQNVTEIADYARHRYCRHGYLANYLGGVPRTNCAVCDHCGATLPTTTVIPLLTEADQQRLILTVLAQRGWGRRNLIGLLRGDPEGAEAMQTSATFGQLSFRSAGAVDKLIDRLIAEQFVDEKRLAHGGVALGITPRGRQQLHAHAKAPSNHAAATPKAASR